MFGKTDTRSLIITMCKCRATCFGHGTRREKLEQLVTTGMLDRKKTAEENNVKKMVGLTKWPKIGRVNGALKGTRNKDDRRR